MFQVGLLPDRPVRGFDGEEVRGLEGARWRRRPIVWGPREPLAIHRGDSVVGHVRPTSSIGWTYDLIE